MSSPSGAEVVVVTGASGGVGRAIAHAFGKRGAHVALLARCDKGLDDCRREVEELGGRALPIPTNVADADAVEAAAERAESELGEIDIWVNDAMATVFAKFVDVTPQEFKRATELSGLAGDIYLARTGFSGQQVQDMPVSPDRPSNLYEPVPDKAATHGIFDAQAKPRSPQLWAAKHRYLVAGAALAVLGAGLEAWQQ